MRFLLRCVPLANRVQQRWHGSPASGTKDGSVGPLTHSSGFWVTSSTYTALLWVIVCFGGEVLNDPQLRRRRGKFQLSQCTEFRLRHCFPPLVFFLFFLFFKKHVNLQQQQKQFQFHYFAPLVKRNSTSYPVFYPSWNGQLKFSTF